MLIKIAMNIVVSLLDLLGAMKVLNIISSSDTDIKSLLFKTSEKRDYAQSAQLAAMIGVYIAIRELML